MIIVGSDIVVDIDIGIDVGFFESKLKDRNRRLPNWDSLLPSYKSNCNPQQNQPHHQIGSNRHLVEMKIGSDIVIGIGIDLGFESKLKHRNHRNRNWDRTESTTTSTSASTSKSDSNMIQICFPQHRPRHRHRNQINYEIKSNTKPTWFQYDSHPKWNQHWQRHRSQIVFRNKTNETIKSNPIEIE